MAFRTRPTLSPEELAAQIARRTAELQQAAVRQAPSRRRWCRRCCSAQPSGLRGRRARRRNLGADIAYCCLVIVAVVGVFAVLLFFAGIAIWLRSIKT